MTQGQLLSGSWFAFRIFHYQDQLVYQDLKSAVFLGGGSISIAGRRIVGVMPFHRVEALCEMQTASSKICTWVAKPISYDNNRYITDASYIYK